MKTTSRFLRPLAPDTPTKDLHFKMCIHTHTRRESPGRKPHQVKHSHLLLLLLPSSPAERGGAHLLLRVVPLSLLRRPIQQPPPPRVVCTCFVALQVAGWASLSNRPSDRAHTPALLSIRVPFSFFLSSNDT